MEVWRDSHTSQRIPKTASKTKTLGTRKEGFPYWFQREHGSTNTLISSFQNYETITIFFSLFLCFFRSSSLQYFITTALGSKYVWSWETFQGGYHGCSPCSITGHVILSLNMWSSMKEFQLITNPGFSYDWTWCTTL